MSKRTEEKIKQLLLYILIFSVTAIFVIPLSCVLLSLLRHREFIFSTYTHIYQPIELGIVLAFIAWTYQYKHEKKKYKVGMYGGKFMPFHKGHLYCVETAAGMCEKLYVILFHGGDQELKILKERPNEKFLTYENRLQHVKEGCKHLKNVVVIDIDTTECKFPDGRENWDMETSLVLNACGHLDAVFGSEKEYADYFSRAYPDAKYVLIDVDRKKVPISGTKIRAMSEEERKKWII